MTEAEHFIIEAAIQLGFQPTDDEWTQFSCSDLQIVDFISRARTQGRKDGLVWNHDMSQAPKDRPILGLCKNQCSSDDCSYSNDPKTTSWRGTLCLHHAHAEGLSAVEEGPHVVVWGGGWSDGYEDGGGWMPDWWFQFGSQFEAAANPIAWMEIPSGQH